MRVALLVTDLERGGTPLRLARLARGLRAAGVDVAIGCLAPLGPIGAELAGEGFSTFACDARHPRDWSALKRLAKHIKHLHPHVLHATLVHANVAARLVGLAQGVPVLTSTATIEVERRWHVWAERLTGWLDRGHIVQSETLAAHVRRAFWRRDVFVIPPSLTIEALRIPRDEAHEALGIPANEFVVAWAGRFDPVKRIGRIVEVAELMSAAPVRFLLAGDGSDRAAVERAIRQSSAGRIIHLLGWRDDLAPVLSAADAFMFPSLTEGMPNAVLEAMACGLPVVGSDIPALRELSADGTRLVLAAGDEPRHFAAALAALRDDPTRAAAIGSAARAWAQEQLRPEATIKALLAIYQRVKRPGD